MNPEQLSHRAAAHLHKLCTEIPTRRVGSRGNQEAAAFFEQQMQASGFQTETAVFDCMDWRGHGAQLSVDGEAFSAAPGPYSPGCEVRGPLQVVATVEELAAAELDGALVLLHGPIASQQLMPKNFPFYNPDEHKHIIRLLESKGLLAIIVATTRDPEMVGGLYPFPLIEDGDFDIPSVFMTDEEGQRLAAQAGREALLQSRAERIPSTGWNVIARKGAQYERRITCFAHIDAKAGTPGAVDNASGVVVLLLLAELLADYTGGPGIEIVAINGEDYYSSPGELLYLECNAGMFDRIMLGINIDGVGFHKGRTAYSLYECPQQIARLASAVFSDQQEFVAGEPWYQSDHFLFIMNQRPALALTSEHSLMEIIHTTADRPEIVDPHKLVAAAFALHDLLLRLAAETT